MTNTNTTGAETMTTKTTDTAFPPVPANIQRMWARMTREAIAREIDQAEDGSDREKARAASCLDDGTYSYELEKMSAEDAALWLIDRADQDLSCDDHYRWTIGPKSYGETSY